MSKPLCKPTGGPYSRPEDGDIAIVPVEGGIIVGVYDGDEHHVWLGDFQLTIPSRTAYVIPRRHLSAEAGQFIGRRFASEGEARQALRPYLTAAYHAEKVVTPAPATA